MSTLVTVDVRERRSVCASLSPRTLYTPPPLAHRRAIAKLERGEAGWSSRSSGPQSQPIMRLSDVLHKPSEARNAYSTARLLPLLLETARVQDCSELIFAKTLTRTDIQGPQLAIPAEGLALLFDAERRSVASLVSTAAAFSKKLLLADRDGCAWEVEVCSVPTRERQWVELLARPRYTHTHAHKRTHTHNVCVCVCVYIRLVFPYLSVKALSCTVATPRCRCDAS